MSGDPRPETQIKSDDQRCARPRLLDGAHAQMLIQKWQYDLCFRNGQDSWMIEICDGSGSTELVVGFPRQTH